MRRVARRSGRDVVRGVVGLTTVAVGVGVALVPGTARADAVFDAYAQGIGIQASLTNQSLPLGLVIEGIGPEASSHVTSFGQSDAEASFPYTGTVVPGLFGLGPPLLLGLPGIDYPTQAATGAGQPPQDVEFPGISLHAESGVATNYADAVVGGGGDGAGGGRSTSRIERNEAEEILASAQAAFTSLRLGNSLTLSNISSNVAVKADSTTGKLTRSSSFSIGRLSIPGLAITVPKQSPAQLALPNPLPGLPQAPPVPLPPIPLPLAGQTLPVTDLGFVDGTFTMTLPGFGNTKFAVPASAVLDAFKGAGLDMAYQPAVETPTGIQGGVFTVRYTFDQIPENQYFSGGVPVTYNIGQAVASVNLSVAEVPGVATAGADVPTASGAGALNGAAVGSPVTSGSDLAGLPGAAGGVPGTATEPATLALTPVGTDTGSGPLISATSSRTVPLSSDLSSIYFLLVLLVIGQLAVTAGLRLLGVRR